MGMLTLIEERGVSNGKVTCTVIGWANRDVTRGVIGRVGRTSYKHWLWGDVRTLDVRVLDVWVLVVVMRDVHGLRRTLVEAPISEAACAGGIGAVA